MFGSLHFTRFTATLAFVAISSAAVSAQCLDWAPGNEIPGVVGYQWVIGEGYQPTIGDVRAFTVFDDGSGPALYVGGRFNRVGGIAVGSIAKWDGTSWSDVGGGLQKLGAAATVRALAVFDDGTGPALYAAGYFADGVTVDQGVLMRWDGSTWSEIAPIGPVYALQVFDDGSGEALYVAGLFTNGGGIAGARGVVRWDGSTWSIVGNPHAIVSFDGVSTLAIFDDGSGPALFAGSAGFFSTINGVSSSECIAKWDGAAWSRIDGMGHAVKSMSVFDDGGGAALYVAGLLSGSHGVRAWDGSALSTLVSSVGITALDVFIDPSGGGRRLYVSGGFASIGGVSALNLAKWDGSAWSAVGNGVRAGAAHAFVKWNGDIYAGGEFASSAATALNGVGRWDGATWSPLGSGNGVAVDVNALAVHDDGSGPKLLAAGTVRTAGAVSVSGTAQLGGMGIGVWDGSAWSQLGIGTTGGTVHALASYDAGSGAEVYIGGQLLGWSGGGLGTVARWNGTSWLPVPSATFNVCTQLAVYDAPGAAAPRLIMAGPDDVVVKQWDGTTTSVIGTTNGVVEALTVYDDGSGPQLVIGGPFTQVNGVNAVGIARWNGTAWSAIGTGTGAPVTALEVFHDGRAGPAQLYAAILAGIGSPLAVHADVLRWNGSSWSNIGATETVTGTSSGWPRINDLAVFADGTTQGQALYVGGDFTEMGGVSAQNLACWNGSAWSEVGGGAENIVRALCAFGDGTDAAPDLWIGGIFNEVGGVPSRSIATWRGCDGVGEPFCFADGTLASDCPCTAPSTVPLPQGSAFGGCANAFNPHGGSLTGSGTTNPDTVTLHASGMSPSGFTIFVRGDASIAGGFASHDGVRCAGGALVRFGSQTAVNGRATYPNPGLGLTLPLSVVSGVIPGSGVTNFYQPFYRNVTAGFCGPGTGNFTSGYRVAW